MGTFHPRRALRRSGRALLALSLSALLSQVLFSPLRIDAADLARVYVDGKVLTAPGSASTVREVLKTAGVTLAPEDEVSPPPDAALPADGMIRVTRVRYEEGTVERPFPYKTVVRPATRGNRPYHPTVTAEGRNGLKRITYRAKIVDGRETQRTTLREEVVREPVPQIVTSRKPHALASRGAYAGRRTFRMLSTAYDPGPGSCGKWADGKTCNGKRAGYGIIAVDPKVIPLGTKLHVEGYGYGIAADVGGAIKGSRVDLGFNSRSGSFRWGKRWVTVTVVD